MKTFVVKKDKMQSSRQWVLIDGTGLVLGRLAAYIAHRLKGKHLPHYTPHLDCGDRVIVTNAACLGFTGRKHSTKIYHHHTGYPGGLKQEKLKSLFERKPCEVLRRAVKGMLGNTPMARCRLSSLRVYAGDQHEHAAQQPEVLDFSALNSKNSVTGKV